MPLTLFDVFDDAWIKGCDKNRSNKWFIKRIEKQFGKKLSQDYKIYLDGNITFNQLLKRFQEEKEW